MRRGPGRGWGGGQLCGTRVEGRAKSWAGSWGVGMNTDPANRHSWALKTRAT